jgi:hypothetical protein
MPDRRDDLNMSENSDQNKDNQPQTGASQTPATSNQPVAQPPQQTAKPELPAVQTPTLQDNVINLHKQRFGVRKISKQLGVTRYQVEQILLNESRPLIKPPETPVRQVQTPPETVRSTSQTLQTPQSSGQPDQSTRQPGQADEQAGGQNKIVDIEPKTKEKRQSVAQQQIPPAIENEVSIKATPIMRKVILNPQFSFTLTMYVKH